MTRIETLTPAQIQSAERVLSAGTWGITAGAVLFSVLTVTPLVERVTPDGWGWTAPLLPLVVDAAVVIVVRLDATVDRLRTSMRPVARAAPVAHRSDDPAAERRGQCAPG